MRRALLTWLVLVPLAGVPTGCGRDGNSATIGDAAADTATLPAPAGNSKSAARHERPLPAFEGRGLDGKELSISSFIGKRLLLFFFNPEVDEALPVAQALARLLGLRTRHNFDVVGVAMGSTADKARAFIKATGLDLPVFDDSSASISRKFGLRVPVGVIGVDAEGYLTFALGSFPENAAEPAAAIEADLRERMRLPDDEHERSGALDARPLAPLFEAERLKGGSRFRLADLSGRPLVLFFFLHSCSHCHDALAFFKEQLAAMPEKLRPSLIGVSVQARPASIRAMLEERDLDFFPVLLDGDRAVQNAYGVFGGVPDILLIDSERRIVQRIQGWRSDRDPALTRMSLARLAGTGVPMLLNPKGYTGNDVCSVCHEDQHATWLFTRHASAFDTLVTHTADRRGECVSCHVVGYDDTGGYSLDERPSHLEGVGCETCHGRGGPHLSPGFVRDGNYEKICQSCHNPTHSLGFDYAQFHPRVSHRAIAALSDAERRKLVTGRREVRDLLPKNARFVGSDACRGCHAAEYETWAASPHAHAVDSLKDKGESGDCLACHTTAFGRPGGFPPRSQPTAHPDLARVGCESCHGPGGNHIEESETKIGSIVSLGDKCDSCVVLQICGACHDEANDPSFRFQLEERIDRQRHGTIEPGTGRPKGASSARIVPAAAGLEAELARVLALVEEKS
ncbi:MAG: multiheme c-type cytochrome [Myxococcota bacterium]